MGSSVWPIIMTVGGGRANKTRFPLPLWSLHRSELCLDFFYSSLSFRWSFKQTMAVIIRNEVFSCFVFYGVLLLLKMYIIAIITGQVRLRKKVSDYQRAERNLISALKDFHWCQVFFSFPKKAFANPEDALRHGGLEFYRLDPDVERCRR